MPFFQYEALDAAGASIRGRLEAESVEAIRTRLASLHYVVVDIKETRPSNAFNFFQRFRRVKLKELALFSRQFSAMINAGLSVGKALDILRQQMRDATMREVVTEIKSDVSSGLSLGDGMSRHPKVFSGLYLSMIRAAEAGGVLDEVMDRLSNYLEAEHELKSKVKSAMMYPVLVFGFAMLVLAGLVLFILPNFKFIFDSMNLKLPLSTRILIDGSTWTRDHWYAPLFLMAVFVTGYVIFSRTEKGADTIDGLKLKVPVFGEMMLKLSISRFSRTFSTLISSGVPILRSMEIVMETLGNRVVAKAVQGALRSVKEGDRLSTPLMNSGIFPPMVTQMMAVGEETGRLDFMLSKVSDFYEREVDATLKGLTSLIEPLMIIGVGAIVAFVAISVISPIYSLVGSIGTEG